MGRDGLEVMFVDEAQKTVRQWSFKAERAGPCAFRNLGTRLPQFAQAERGAASA